jgi:hypothetical protein
VGAFLASIGTAASMRSSVATGRGSIALTGRGWEPFYALGIVNRSP